MPGVIINIAGNQEQLSTALSTLKFDRRFKCSLLFEAEKTQIFFNNYPGYPHTVFENDAYFCVVEGLIYNSILKSEVNSLFALLEKNAVEEIAEIIKRLDGEFVFCFYLKSEKRIVLINDSWGRLPIYFAKNERSIVISREISFVKSVVEPPQLSTIDAALYTMFGYTLGEETIYQGIAKVAPNSVLSTSELKFENRSFFKMDRYFHSTKRVGHEELIRNLQEAIFQRVDLFDRPSLSLSGGLDSRLIAGLIAKENYDVSFTTYDYPGMHEAMDLKGAQEIVESLGVAKQHEVIALPDLLASNKKYLLNIKQGLNGVDMAFLIPYLRSISESSDCSLTGDGGDKFLVNLKPSIPITTRKQLIRYLLKRHAQVSPELAGRFFDVSKKQIISRIIETLESYGRSDWSEIYAAFQIKERGVNWLFEGEDRNRYFIWSTSPFYSPLVIENAMSFPMSAKNQGGLFYELFKLLPGALGSIVNPNWKVPLDARSQINWLHQKQKLKAFVPKSMLGVKREKVSTSPLYDQLEKNQTTSPINLTGLESDKVDPIVLQRLATLVGQV